MYMYDVYVWLSVCLFVYSVLVTLQWNEDEIWSVTTVSSINKTSSFIERMRNDFIIDGMCKIGIIYSIWFSSEGDEIMGK